MSCLGGGSGSDSQTTTFPPEITDDRVAAVTLLVTDDFQRANGESFILLTVIARDRTNTPLSGVEINLTSNSDYAVILDPIGATEANGRFTTAIVSSVAETVAVTATAGGVPGESVNVTFIAPVDLIELSASETVLSTNESTTVTIKINEEFTDKPLPNTPIEVTVSGSATLNSVPSTTNNNGQATFTVTNMIPETVTITVTSGQISQTLTLYFGATLTLIPESTNALDNVTLTALLKDNFQTPIADQEITFRFVNENNATLTPLMTTTGENGTATVTVTDLANEGGTVVVQANSGALSAQSTVTFGELLVDPRVETIDIVVSNNSQLANGRDQIIVTVIARDVVKAPLSDVPVSLVSTSDIALFETLNGTTGENGRFTTTVTSTEADTFEVMATAGGKQDKKEITFVALVGEIVLRASNQVLLTGETSEITLTILKEVELEELLEKFGVFFDDILFSGDILDQLREEKILLGDTPFKVNAGNATLNEVPEKTNQNGQASFTVTHEQAENIMLTVTSGSVTRTLPLYFGATLNLLPKTVNATATTTFNALLKDGNHAPIADQEVSFNFVGENDETLTPITAITGANGTAEVTVTDLEQNGGTAGINVSSGTLNAQATVNFITVFGENRQLAAETSATVLNTNESATITVSITNDKKLPIEGQPVSFSVLRADGQPSSAQLSVESGISNVQGEVITTVSNSVAENVIVTVQADTATQEISLYFGANVKLSPTESEGFSDGITSVELTAIVSDAQNAIIADIPVDFRVINGQALIDKFRDNTDDSGEAKVNVTSSVVEQAQVEAQAQNLTPTAIASIAFNPSQPDNLTLSTEADSLSLNGETSITAIVTDNQRNAIKNTPVTFSTDIGNITETVLTDNQGQAQATFSATTQAGLATITATAGSATDTLTLTIQSGSAGTIEINNIEPQVIGIMGSGVIQTATIEFLIKDSLGNLVADGTPVNFSLGETTLGGGETISTEGETGKTAIGTTNNGIVSVTLKSGRVAGNIDVIATVNNTISTVARITIVGGMPDADHLSLAVEYNNIAGSVLFGLRNEIIAYVGDRFGNVVPDGTAVSFITEGGTIGTSIEAGAFTTPVEFGQATAILQSSAPTTPNLGGVPTSQTPIGGYYECSGFYEFLDNTAPGSLACSNPGLVTIVAYTTGSESFVDQNGNGFYDAGEPFRDLSEPYIDGNDNFVFDEGELYIDVNGDGQFNHPDDQFQENTTIWTSRSVLFSSETATFEVIPDSFQIPNGGSQTFTIINNISDINTISDIYGNALVEGTRFQVTSSNGVLSGTTDFTLGDNIEFDQQISFTLASNPPEIITETDEDGNVISSRFEYPPSDSATITITITSPLQDNAPGGNGNVEKVISGSINN
jgi:adhesin/invasin